MAVGLAEIRENVKKFPDGKKIMLKKNMWRKVLFQRIRIGEILCVNFVNQIHIMNLF